MRINFSAVREQARGQWPYILRECGIGDEYLSGRHGPCPGCGGRDRFRFDDQDSNGTFYCGGGGEPISGDGFHLIEHTHGCTAADALHMVASCLGIEEGTAPPPVPAKPVKRTELSEDERERLRAKLRRQFLEASKATEGGQTAAYLRSRGLNLSVFPQTLRDEATRYWMPADPAPVDLGPCAAMLAAIQGPDGKLVGLHRTFIKDGHKALFTDPATDNPLPAKKMRAAWRGSTKGGAVRLFDAGPELVVAEGIETALAAHIITGRPAWAALSAGGLAAVMFPEKTRDILIAADADEAGERAAHALAARLIEEGKVARIAAPETGDWADVIAGGDCG